MLSHTTSTALGAVIGTMRIFASRPRSDWNDTAWSIYGHMHNSPPWDSYAFFKVILKIRLCHYDGQTFKSKGRALSGISPIENHPPLFAMLQFRNTRRAYCRSSYCICWYNPATGTDLTFNSVLELQCFIPQKAWTPRLTYIPITATNLPRGRRQIFIRSIRGVCRTPLRNNHGFCFWSFAV